MSDADWLFFKLITTATWFLLIACLTACTISERSGRRPTKPATNKPVKMPGLISAIYVNSGFCFVSSGPNETKRNAASMPTRKPTPPSNKWECHKFLPMLLLSRSSFSLASVSLASIKATWSVLTSVEFASCWMVFFLPLICFQIWQQLEFGLLALEMREDFHD